MTARPRTEWPRAAALTLVLTLHGLLLWHWPAVRPDTRIVSHAPSPVIVAVRIATAPPAREEQAAPAGAPVPGRAPRKPQPDVTTATPRSASPQTLAIAPGSVAEPASAPGSAAAAAAPSATDRPLNLALPRGAGAERGALTEPPGSMRRAALNDPRSNIGPDPTRALPDAVAASTKGDCLKGEFAGGGMGLLSLPFLAAAALRGDCRPTR